MLADWSDACISRENKKKFPGAQPSRKRDENWKLTNWLVIFPGFPDATDLEHNFSGFQAGQKSTHSSGGFHWAMVLDRSSLPCQIAHPRRV
jgi:hypothetical protein